MEEQRQKDLNKVVDIDTMYGYEQEEQKKKDEDKYGLLKLLLQHLDNKKKYYLRKVD